VLPWTYWKVYVVASPTDALNIQYYPHRRVQGYRTPALIAMAARGGIGALAMPAGARWGMVVRKSALGKWHAITDPITHDITNH